MKQQMKRRLQVWAREIGEERKVRRREERRPRGAERACLSLREGSRDGVVEFDFGWGRLNRGISWLEWILRSVCEPGAHVVDGLTLVGNEARKSPRSTETVIVGEVHRVAENHGLRQ